MTTYVAGFLFRKHPDFGIQVALIQKTHPAFQAGKWNGIGGHIEPGEDELTAQCREFQQETGARVTEWQRFCVIKNKNYQVTFFRSNQAAELASMTDETVRWFSLPELLTLPMLPNVRWLIPMALDPAPIQGAVIETSAETAEEGTFGLERHRANDLFKEVTNGLRLLVRTKSYGELQIASPRKFLNAHPEIVARSRIRNDGSLDIILQ